MSLRIERSNTHSVASFDVPFWKTCAVRIENVVSKYFLEWAECFLPHNTYKGWAWLVQWTYWSVKDWFFPCWMRQFKSGVQLATVEPVFKYTSKDLAEFLHSAEGSKLKRMFPFKCLWDKGEITNWFRPEMGTCYGESLALMKYHNHIPSGNEVLFLQAMHFLDAHLKWIVQAKKQMKNHHIGTRDIASKESNVQQAWLFHYLRKSEIPRGQARYLAEHCQELFLLPLSELQNMHSSIAPGIEEIVGESLDFHAYASDGECTQRDLDRGVTDFLLQNSGMVTLIGRGKKETGHAMFLKIEEGQCMTYDPATKECFTVPHTSDGIYKTLELMKKLLALPNLGGKTRYGVIAL